jgi:DNA helicase II / ATP-dependent DNA helicase PcrA
MNREELNQKFELIFDQLNPEQRQAVSTIDGPVLVIAGPGTGKTQILSARIGKILLETDYLPDNILCLTYTDAGRVAMRKRLQGMIGADAYRVNIHTFHSFCNQIIQENTSFFQKNSVDAISEIETIDFLKQLIDSLSSSNPLRRMSGDPYYEIDRLKNLFTNMKREGWSSEFIKEKADEYIADLPNREVFIYKRKTVTKTAEYQKGDLKVNDIQKEKDRMELLKYAVDAFDQYQQILKEHHRYDFDDMINWVIAAFEQDENILADNQERYQFILVDEYQDTNGSQNKLIELLTQNIENPNIFVVGDDDQSIFRFQGASVENIETYKNTFADSIAKIVLKTNYRSTQIILDSSRSVIENNEERLSKLDTSIVKHLIAGNAIRLISKNTPKLHVYENLFQEMVGITERVYKLIYIEKVNPEQIAILFTTNKMGAEFIKFFQAKQIPYYSKTKENLFGISLAKKMIQIMRYIARETSIPYSADDLLFEILHFDLYQIPPFEIAKASVRVGDMRHSTKTSLRTYLQDWVNTVNPTLFENKPHDGIIELTGLLEKWIQDSFNTTIINLVESIMIEGKLLAHAMESDDKIWHLDVLRSMMNFVKEEMHRNPNHTITSLVEVIDTMNEQGLPITLFRTFGIENGVNLLTAHGSKGLEFQYVFLMNATAESWEKKKVPSSNYKIPDNILSTQNTENEKEKTLEEKRRLFFVAMTRAEEHLIISWSKQDDKEKYTEPSMFISEITDKISLERITQKLEATQLEDYLHIYLLRNKQPVLHEGEREFVTAIVARFEMNVTALNNYLNCPLRFYYNNILRIPGGRSEASSFGSAVHHALERLFKKMQENENEFKPVDDLLNDFYWHMNRNRESFTIEGLKRKMEYGTIILTALYNENVAHWHKVVAIERMFKGVVVDGVPLKGMLDKLEFDYNSVTVVDYKTGNPANSKERIMPPTAKKPNGGDYWRQGVFYKILVDNYKPKNYKVVKTIFQYVEPDELGNYTSKEIIPSPDDINIVKAQIKDTWQKVQAHDFYTGCGEENCTWCNFAKDNKQYRSLIQMSNEIDNEEE